MATPSADCALRGPAIFNFPAPTLSAAVPASTSAPGTSAAPPITIAMPRSCLSARSSGCGSRQRRKSAPVTATGRLLARANLCVRLRRHGCSCLLERGHEVEQLETQVAARSESLIVFIQRDRTVCDLRLLVDGQQL